MAAAVRTVAVVALVGLQPAAGTGGCTGCQTLYVRAGGVARWRRCEVQRWQGVTCNGRLPRGVLAMASRGAQWHIGCCLGWLQILILGLLEHTGEPFTYVLSRKSYQTCMALESWFAPVCYDTNFVLPVCHSVRVLSSFAHLVA